MELEFQFSPVQLQTQKQHMSASMQYEQWRVNPLAQVPETESVKQASIQGLGLGGFNKAWMQIRRRIFAQGAEGGNVNIGIEGNASSNKSETAQAFLYLATHDFYLHTEAARKGIAIVPRTMPFALGAKALQLPPPDGPGIIREDADHGRFSSEEYARISSSIQIAFNSYVSGENIRPGIVNLNILEGSGLPYPEKTGYPVRLFGMADRGVSPIDNLAYHPTQAKNSFIFLMHPNQQVQQFGLAEREFDPETQDLDKIFNGRVCYEVSKGGVIVNVADMREEMQRDVVRLLRMSMAPKAAAERSNAEYSEMKIALVDDAEILSNTLDETYMEALRDRLIAKVSNKPQIPADQVYIVETSFWRGFEDQGSNVRNLDYLLKHCVWSKSYPQLIPTSLRRFL